MGGVEIHLFNLSQCLLQRGHRVVIVTHAYGGDRVGVRWMTGGLKVYYLPMPEMYNSCTFPTIWTNLPSLRAIFLAEQIQVVHGHQVS